MIIFSPLQKVCEAEGGRFQNSDGWLLPFDFGSAAAEYEQARTQAALFDVSNRSKIEVTGKDASIFLHNLSTNDVKGLATSAGCEAFLATAKAKVVAHLLIYHHAKAYWLDSVAGQADKIIKHLDHFLVSEQVEFTDRTYEYAQMHLAGPQASVVLAKALVAEGSDLKPFQLREVTHDGVEGQIRRDDPLGLPGYDLVVRADQSERVWRRLVDAGARPAGLTVHGCLRIEAGTPVYGRDIDENTLAPEVNRTAQAICYTKGCFLGQEPIVRARDIGHVNRTLHGLIVEAQEAVPQGTVLLRDGKEVGQVTSSAVSPRLQTAVALAYVRRGHSEPGTVVTVRWEGKQCPARVTPLPVVV
jgi:folate-binding protein YgfZ